MADPSMMKTARAMLAGAVVAVLLIVVVGFALWLSSTTGSNFEITLGAIVIIILVAVIAGYFTAGTSSIIGFATRWKADLAILFPVPDDDDDLLRDTRRTRDAFLSVAMLGVVAMFVYSLQWKPAGFAQVFGSALMIALAALGVGIFLGFLFGIPRTLADGVRPAPPPSPQGAAQGPAPATPPPNPNNAVFGVNTNLEQISDWLTKIIVGLGLINLGKLPGKVRSFVSQVAPSVGGQYGFTSAIVVTYAVCGFMLGYLLTRLYLARAFARAFARSVQAADAAAGIQRVIERVGADTATNVDVGQRSAEVDPVSAGEKVAAVRVEQLAEKADTEHLRSQLDALAHEYETVRGAMLPSPARTKAMEVVASKLRTLGRACYAWLPSLVGSESPGHRLAAISFLETQPSRDYLNWLAQRFAVEKPFLQYHAAWALRHAAGTLPVTDLDAVDRAIRVAIENSHANPAHDPNALRILMHAISEVGNRRKTG